MLTKQEQPIFGTVEAAEYLEISFATLKHHIYNSGRLMPDRKVGGRLFFHKNTLDEFKLKKRKPGRPPKEE